MNMNKQEEDFVGSLKALLIRHNVSLGFSTQSLPAFTSNDSDDIFLFIPEIIDALNEGRWSERDSMFNEAGTGKNFRCTECGSNVFRKSVDGTEAKCNGCQTTFLLEV